MVQVQQRVLIAVALCAAAAVLAPATNAPKFYPDDPLMTMPAPRDVGKPNSRKLSEYFDYFHHTLNTPGDLNTEVKQTPALSTNSIDEVPDSGWYVNRHYRRRMSRDALRRGPGDAHAPARGEWTITRAKSEGITPGFEIRDSTGRRYVFKFDPPDAPELASAADVIGSKFFYALGYYVPENYIAHFRREDLRIDPKAMLIDQYGRKRPLADLDIEKILKPLPTGKDGRYRALASLFVEGDLLGPFRFHGTRSDDPNDVIPHEHRRELRGMHVFAAWLAHNDIKSLNSLDTVIEENGSRFIRHYLIDFGAALGSDSWTEKTPRAGNEYLFSWTGAAKQFFSFGLYTPAWMRAGYPDIRGVGRFESEIFEPEEWKANYPNPAFLNRLPTDSFWGAKQVMAFTDDDIRAIVELGQFEDPQAVEWLVRTLAARRDKIGRKYFSMVVPLDNFEITGGRIRFDDLAVKHGFSQPKDYTIQWARFDNRTSQKSPLPEARNTPIVPEALASAPEGSYFSADIHNGESRRAVTVYFRAEKSGPKLVGIERTW